MHYRPNRARFQSTLPMRGETHCALSTSRFPTCYFNPLSPCGERPLRPQNPGRPPHRFQSTLPMRGETFGSRHNHSPCNHFNPLSPCGERPRCSMTELSFPPEFQSTLPMRGETSRLAQSRPFQANFNPLSPCGERRFYTFRHERSIYISIHSPHAGRDLADLVDNPHEAHFNPLSPCGERLFASLLKYYHGRFQSTLPMRGETNAIFKCRSLIIISIHSPHAGRDSAAFRGHETKL